MASDPTAATATTGYAERLAGLQLKGWKRRLRGLDPWGWNLRRLAPGFTLDVGCGVGRTLAQLRGHGVGIDHNPDAVARCRAQGLRAYTPEEFAVSPWAEPGRFDALLLAHVLEHLDADTGGALVARYLPCLRAGGQVIVLTPQERGQASDPTHVRFVDHGAAAALLEAAGLVVTRRASFPLPPAGGRWLTYNEFVTVARRSCPW